MDGKAGRIHKIREIDRSIEIWISREFVRISGMGMVCCNLKRESDIRDYYLMGKYNWIFILFNRIHLS